MENQNSPQQQAADLRMMLDNEPSQQRSSRRNSRGTTLSDIDTMSYDELVAYISDSNSDFADDDADFEGHTNTSASSNGSSNSSLFAMTKQPSSVFSSLASTPSASKSLEDERREEEERAKRAVPYSFASLGKKQPSDASNKKAPEVAPARSTSNQAAEDPRRAAMSAMRTTTPDPEEYPEYYQQQPALSENFQSQSGQLSESYAQNSTAANMAISANSFGADGYDAEGFDRDGFDRDGFDRYNYDREGYDWEGYNSEGFDRDGFDRDGFDKYNYDREGYDWEGYNSEGFDREGFDRDGFDKYNYDREGYDWEGYNQYGLDRQGFDRSGFDADGYDREGFDTEGFDREGFDRDGFDRYNYNREGYDWEGYDCEGYDYGGFDRNGYDKEGYTRQDWEAAGYKFGARGEFILPENEAVTAQNDQDAENSSNIQTSDKPEEVHKDEQTGNVELQTSNNEGEVYQEDNNEIEASEVTEPELYSDGDLQSEVAVESVEPTASQPNVDKAIENNANTEAEASLDHNFADAIDQPAEAEIASSGEYPQEEQYEEYQPEEQSYEAEQQEYVDEEYQHEDLPSEAEQQEYADEEYQHEDLPNEAEQQEYVDEEYQHEDLPSEAEQQEYADEEYQHEDLPSEAEQQEYADEEYQHEDLPSEAEQQEYTDEDYQHEDLTSEAEQQSNATSEPLNAPRNDVPLYEPEQQGKFGNMTSPWRYECDYAIDYESGNRRGQRIALLASEMGDERTFTIGSPGERVNDIEVDESSIANDQALLRYSNGRFTFINFQEDIKINKRIVTCGEQVNLLTGDEIALGNTTLVFRERCVSETLAEYSLDVIEGAETDLNKSFTLTKQRSSIGRDRNSDILLTDQEISRNHCTLTFRNGKFYLQHRSDTNPTFINGVSVPAGGERQITTDDKIQISSRTILQLTKH